MMFETIIILCLVVAFLIQQAMAQRGTQNVAALLQDMLLEQQKEAKSREAEVWDRSRKDVAFYIAEVTELREALRRAKAPVIQPGAMPWAFPSPPLEPAPAGNGEKRRRDLAAGMEI